jgi:hypothetical protein
VDADARCFRVALVSGELLNARDGDVDALAVLEAEEWGAIQLPAADYPDEVAGPLLEQVAEQVEEFARHGYTLAVIGGRPGLDEALARVGVAAPPAFDPETAGELRAFLAASCK